MASVRRRRERAEPDARPFREASLGILARESEQRWSEATRCEARARAMPFEERRADTAVGCGLKRGETASVVRWRVSAEADARRGERRRHRSEAPCRDTRVRRGGREPPAKGAQRPSHGGGGPRVWPHAPASEARSEQRERRRQGSSPEGRRPRQRASWSRAGRSRARRNRARRPVPGPGGRPDHAGGTEAKSGRHRP